MVASYTFLCLVAFIRREFFMRFRQIAFVPANLVPETQHRFIRIHFLQIVGVVHRRHAEEGQKAQDREF
jgi:hypothetical protein